MVPQRFHVELDRRILRPFIGERVRLEIAEMRRHHRSAAAPVQCVENGPAQRRPLGRIGARSEFVEQDESVRPRVPQDVRDP